MGSLTRFFLGMCDETVTLCDETVTLCDETVTLCDEIDLALFFG
jgi:hypothetical protein